MSLIECPECKREISDKAAVCPHCGCPAAGKVKKLVRSKILRGVLIAVLAAGALGGAFLWRAKVAEPEKIIISQKDDFETKQEALEVMGAHLGVYTFCKDQLADSANDIETVTTWINETHNEEESSLLQKAFLFSVAVSAKTFLSNNQEKEFPFFDDNECKKIKAAYERFVLE